MPEILRRKSNKMVIPGRFLRGVSILFNNFIKFLPLEIPENNVPLTTEKHSRAVWKKSY